MHARMQARCHTPCVGVPPFSVRMRARSILPLDLARRFMVKGLGFRLFCRYICASVRVLLRLLRVGMCLVQDARCGDTKRLCPGDMAHVLHMRLPLLRPPSPLPRREQEEGSVQRQLDFGESAGGMEGGSGRAGHVDKQGTGRQLQSSLHYTRRCKSSVACAGGVGFRVYGLGFEALGQWPLPRASGSVHRHSDLAPRSERQLISIPNCSPQPPILNAECGDVQAQQYLLEKTSMTDKARADILASLQWTDEAASSPAAFARKHGIATQSGLPTTLTPNPYALRYALLATVEAKG
jgi:hypothetical protein